MLSPSMKATDEELTQYLEQLIAEELAPALIIRKLLNAYNFGVPWNRLQFPD